MLLWGFNRAKPCATNIFPILLPALVGDDETFSPVTRTHRCRKRYDGASSTGKTHEKYSIGYRRRIFLRGSSLRAGRDWRVARHARFVRIEDAPDSSRRAG